MLGREFVKRIRLLMGQTETVRTWFDLNKDGTLVEHVSIETSDWRSAAAKTREQEEAARSAAGR